jgi:hypothetical protein
MTTHRTTATVVAFELHLQFEGPVARGIFEDLPAGPTVHVTRNNRRIANAPIGARGRVSLQVPVAAGSARFAIEIDFAGFEWLDSLNPAWVAQSALRPNDKRALIRMPALWQSRRQRSFRDDLGGRFQNGQLSDPTADQQGTAAAPWVIQIDHGWDRIDFELVHYDTEAMAMKPVPQGMLLEAFRAASMTAQNRVGASAVLTDDGLLSVAIHTRTQRARLHFRLSSAAGTFVDMRQHRPSARVVIVAPATFSGLPAATQRKHYALPERWTSPNQRASFGGTADTFANLISRSTTPSNRIQIDLDDAMLVSATGSPVPVPTGSASRLALFDHVMSIKNPDGAQPYLSTDTITGNFIPGALTRVAGQNRKQCTRVIRFGNGFYDLLNRRTTSGSRIGVRAARRNDHPFERVRNPFVADTGLFELHYFHDCWTDTAGEPLAHLLVYWSARFRKGAATTPDPPAPQVPATPTTAQVRAFETALETARVRHEGWHPSLPARTQASQKHYFFKPEPAAASPRRTIKPVFHFAGFRNNEAITRISVRSHFRDETGPTSATYEVPSAAAVTTDTETDVDGLVYEGFVFPHEIGHSLGLDDEYIESLETPASWTANSLDADRFPQFEQWGTRHLRFDAKSLMNGNYATRLRHFWHYANWVNTHAAAQALLAGTQYKIEYKASSTVAAKDFSFFLPRAHANYYNAVHSANNFSNGHGRMHLGLFRLGEDETSLMPGDILNPGGAPANGIDAVLNVRIHFNYRFVGPGWTPQQQHDALDLIELVSEALRGVHRWHTLEDAGAPAFRKVLLNFEFRYNTAGGAGRHFRLNSRIAGPAAAVSDLDNPATTSATIRVRHDTNPIQIFRYTLGLPFVTVTPGVGGAAPTVTPNRSFVAGDLAFLVTWLNGQRDTAPDNTGGHTHAYVHRRYPP